MFFGNTRTCAGQYRNCELFLHAINMCEGSHCKSKTHKFANFSVLPVQVQNRAGQKYRVPRCRCRHYWCHCFQSAQSGECWGAWARGKGGGEKELQPWLWCYKEMGRGVKKKKKVGVWEEDRGGEKILVHHKPKMEGIKHGTSTMYGWIHNLFNKNDVYT